MISKASIIFLLLLAFPVVLHAQTIRGTVVDAESGTPLPSATIQLEGTYGGTITNREGEFSIDIEEYPANLLVRYIGYKSRKVKLEEWTADTLGVSLEPSVTELGKIVVTDRDPGLSIMERVIERKKMWRSSLKTYQAEAYTRQVLRNDTSIVSITESGTRSFWDAEQGHREVQLYSRQTTNIGEDENFAGVRFLPNFYDDNITIAGYTLVGVTHPDALDYYDFSLLETLQIDEQPVYKIKVSPKRKLQPLFEGTVYVLGEEYALLEVDITPNEVVDFPPPVQEFNLSYRQQFSNYGQQYWLPVDMRVSGTVDISMIGLRIPTIRFNQTSVLSDYRVNIELPDSLYRKNQEFVRAEIDSAARLSRDPIPLTDEEKRAYETVDSTNTLDKAFEPEGFLARFLNDDNRNDNGGAARFLPDGVRFTGRFNRVDGFNLGVKAGRLFESVGTEPEVFGSYSFHANRWNGGVNVGQKIPFGFSEPSVVIRTAYENEVKASSAGSMYPSILNSFQTLTGGRDYFNYYKSETISGEVEIRQLLDMIDIEAGFSSSSDRSIMEEPGEVLNYSLFGLHRERLPNREIWEGNVNVGRFEIVLNNFGKNFGVTGNRGARIQVEHSAAELGSDFEFSSVDIAAGWSMATFFRRRAFANSLDLELSAGYTFGDLPPQRLRLVDGSMGRITPFGVLKTRNSRPYEGSRYWALSGEHNFGTIPFELAGLDLLANRGWGIIIFGAAAYSDTDEELYSFEPLTTGGSVHSEAGISLNRVFGLLRIDVAKRMDSAGGYVGVSLPRYF